MSQKKNTLVGGVTILGVAGIIAKVLGMFFRVPLGNMIESGGMAVFQTVYSTYGILLAISTAGIPVAVSRLVSESVTLGRHRRATAVLRTSLGLLAAIGAALTVLLVLCAGPLANAIGAPQTRIGFIAIAPSILLVSVMSAFRGYMQGRSRMTPTAISQVIEQVAKVIISFPLAAWGMRYGVVEAAAGALVGISIGEGLALLYMAIVYWLGRKSFALEEAADAEAPGPRRALLSQLVRIALPITIGSAIVPLASFIDTSMIRLRLAVAGVEPAMRETLYGLLSGYVLPLINVPTVLATAVCIGLVPAIASARVEGRTGDMHDASRLGLRLASLISFPCTMGMALLSTPIVHLLYPLLPADEVAIAGSILSLSAWTILLFTHVQASTGILQGAGMHKVPVYSLVMGVVCKVAFNYVLLAVPSINIYGAPIASIVCYAVSMLINIVCIVRRTGMRFDWGAIVLRPGLATAGMGLAVWGVTLVLDMTRRASTLLAVMAGVLVYAVLVFAIGALRREDMDQIPGGGKLERLMLRLRIWR